MAIDKKIIIVDDDADILEILRLMLQTAGYTVVATKNADELFNYKDNLSDLVLLDIWIKRTDGRDVISQLKENELWKDIPVILISANSEIEKITEKYKADDYIAKPFEMAYLLDKVHQILNVKR